MKEIEHQFVNHLIIIKTITYRRNEMLFSLLNLLGDILVG